jgi:hypothetical protein
MVAVAVLGGVLLVGAGCTGGGEPAPTPGPSTSTPDGEGVLSTAPPTVEPTVEPDDFEITYGFDVPGETVEVANPGIQRAYLVGIYTAERSGEGDPRVQSISFYFRGGFPSYRFGYVPAIIRDATGDAVALDGSHFLNVVFVDAQAHDDTTGNSTVAQAPARPIGMTRLVDYANAGDFEGQVTYGIGVAAGRDGRPMIEAAQFTRSDDTGGVFYVVRFDVYASI